MDRFQAQLMAIERFFVNDENNINDIEKIQFTNFEWDDFPENWNVVYTVTYKNGNTIDCHQVINEYAKYDADTLNCEVNIQLILI